MKRNRLQEAEMAVLAETREELLEGLRSLENQVKNEQKRLDILKSIEDVTAYEKILERG